MEKILLCVFCVSKYKAAFPQKELSEIDLDLDITGKERSQKLVERQRCAVCGKQTFCTDYTVQDRMVFHA